MITQNINTILIVVLVLILLLICYFIHLTKLESKKVEYYRRQFALLSATEQAAVLAKKIQTAWDTYILIKNNIPKIKNIFEKLTDWNILKSKMCNWAKNKKLLPGIIAVLNKAINNSNIKQSVKDSLTTFKNKLVKIEATIAAISSIGSVINTLIPSMPSQAKDAINVFNDIDSNLVDLFSKAGVNICN